VLRDKKLLYTPFETCTNIQSAISANYGESGDRKLSGDLRDLVKNDDYSRLVQLADEDIKKNLLDMINSQKEEGAKCKQVAYQTSLIFSEVHHPQEAHVDYDTATENPKKYLVAFLPLTETGQFLQFWKNSESAGEIVFIPRGQLLLVPGKTIHGGGFRADHRTDDMHAHMRLHFYVYPDESQCVFAKGKHKNDYLPKKRKFSNHPELEIPKKGKQGIPTAKLGNAFFHGYSE
jgi:hypothetical protein